MGKTIKTTSGAFMKKSELVWDAKMPPHIPMIIRLDGSGFHKWTKKTKCEKPFDEKLIKLMSETTKFLCENISGSVFGYTQSDEISLLILDNQTSFSEAWFNKRVEKICSISASMATYFFNENNPFDDKFPAFFDSRTFIIPETEVKRYFVWRQTDATKNSLSMLAQSFYSHSELLGKKRSELLKLCFKKGQDWAELSRPKKRGVSVYIKEVLKTTGLKPSLRKQFFIDYETPTFVKQDCKLFDNFSLKE